MSEQVSRNPLEAFARAGGAGEFDAYYDSVSYWIYEPGRDRYNKWDRGLLVKELTRMGRRARPDRDKQELVGEIDAELLRLAHERRVDWVGTLAGHTSGFKEMCGRDILVTRSPDLLTPTEPSQEALDEACSHAEAAYRGIPVDEPVADAVRACQSVVDADPVFAGARGWPVLGQILRRLLTSPEWRERADAGDVPTASPIDGDAVDQRHLFLGWLQDFVFCLHNQTIAQAQCLAMAGQHNSGKSLLAKIVRELSGRRAAKPLKYLVGETQHNADLFAAPLLLVDDEQSKVTWDARLQTGANIKQIVANDFQRCRAMQQDGVELQPLWRLMILMNCEPDRLKILPSMDEDIMDKMVLLMGYSGAMPLPSKPPPERKAFWDVLSFELPSFLHWLLHEYRLPRAFYGQRFTVRDWHHPELLEALNSMSQEARLWEWIERVLFLSDAPVTEWRGSAQELITHLTCTESPLHQEEKRSLASWGSAIAGRKLHDLEKWPKLDGRLVFHRTGAKREWRICRDASAPEISQTTTNYGDMEL